MSNQNTNLFVFTEQYITLKQNNNYEISNTSKIRQISDKKILPQQVFNNEYYVYLNESQNENLSKKSYKVAYLLATNFLENPNNLESVIHKNKDKLDNRLINLEFYQPQNKKKIQQNQNTKLFDVVIQKNEGQFEYLGSYQTFEIAQENLNNYYLQNKKSI